MAPSIQTWDLTRTFGAFVAVDHLTLEVANGEVFGLLGPNGAGKTTTIKMLITLLAPSSGRATVAGHDITGEQRLVRTAIGYVPQLISADGALTARENLDISARLHHVSRADRRERIDASLDFMGLGGVGDRLVRTYSGGMIRRLEIAQAMIHRPTVLFLDEPTLGLDPVAREAVWEHVRGLRERERTTVMLTTHYMDEAAELCDRVGFMHMGRLVALGTPAELEAELHPGASLDEVFAHVSESGPEEGGTYGDVARTRRIARRLG